MSEPTTSELIRDAMSARLADVNVATVGKVQAYDPLTQTASVVPVVKRPIEDSEGEFDHEAICILPNMPVLFPGGGGFFFHFPIEPGDFVLLVFCHDAIGTWRETGEVSEPGDLRRHSLANAVAIPGILPSLAPRIDAPNPGTDPSEAVMLGRVVRVGDKTLALPVALAPIVDAFVTAFNAHTHGTGVGPSTPPAAPFTQSTASAKLKAE